MQRTFSSNSAQGRVENCDQLVEIAPHYGPVAGLVEKLSVCICLSHSRPVETVSRSLRQIGGKDTKRSGVSFAKGVNCVKLAVEKSQPPGENIDIQIAKGIFCMERGEDDR